MRFFYSLLVQESRHAFPVSSLFSVLSLSRNAPDISCRRSCVMADPKKCDFALSHSKLNFYFSLTNESRIESSRPEFVEMVVVSCTASVRFFRIKAQTDLCPSIFIYGAEVTL
jgi:hypothetical protein